MNKTTKESRHAFLEQQISIYDDMIEWNKKLIEMHKEELFHQEEMLKKYMTELNSDGENVVVNKK